MTSKASAKAEAKRAAELASELKDCTRLQELTAAYWELEERRANEDPTEILIEVVSLCERRGWDLPEFAK